MKCQPGLHCEYCEIKALCPDAELTSPMPRILKRLKHLRPRDRIFWIIADWPYPWEWDNKPTEDVFYSQSLIQDMLGTGGIK